MTNWYTKYYAVEYEKGPKGQDLTDDEFSP